jgi:hypothetical protein
MMSQVGDFHRRRKAYGLRFFRNIVTMFCSYGLARDTKREQHYRKRIDMAILLQGLADCSKRIHGGHNNRSKTSPGWM